MKINYTCNTMIPLDLIVEDTLLYYDGPEIWSAKDMISKNYFLCILLGNNEPCQCLAFHTTQDIINGVKSGEICVRTATEHSELCALVTEGLELCSVITPTEDQLPKYGLYLNLK